MRWRAAVYLNNTGVSLLEQGCFEYGLATMLDAIQVTRIALQQQPDSKANLQAPQSSIELVCCLDRAKKRLALCTKAKRLPCEYPLIMVVSDDGSSTIAQATLSRGERFEQLILVRIEGGDFNGPFDLDHDAVLVMANYAQAYKALSLTSDRHEDACELLECSLKVLSLIQATLDPANDGGLEQEHTLRKTSILFLTLQDLRTALVQLGRHSQATVVQEKLESLEPLLTRIEKTPGSQKTRVASAA